MYTDQLNSLRSCWSKQMNSLINHLCFTYTINNFNPDQNTFLTLQRRSRDQFVQGWSENINNTNKLEYYKQFKKTFEYEWFTAKSYIENLSLFS